MMNSLTPISSLSESLDALLRGTADRGEGASAEASREVIDAVDAIKRRSLGLMTFVDRYGNSPIFRALCCGRCGCPR